MATQSVAKFGIGATGGPPRAALPALAPLVGECRDLLNHPAAAAVVDSAGLSALARWIDADHVGIDVLIDRDLDPERRDALARWLAIPCTTFDEALERPERLRRVLFETTIVDLFVGHVDSALPLFEETFDAPLLIHASSGAVDWPDSTDVLGQGRAAVIAIGTQSQRRRVKTMGSDALRTRWTLLSWDELATHPGPVRSVENARALTRLRGLHYLSTALSGATRELDEETVRCNSAVNDLRAQSARLTRELALKKQAVAAASRSVDELEDALERHIAQRLDEFFEIDQPDNAARGLVFSALKDLTRLHVHPRPYDVDTLVLPDEFKDGLTQTLREHVRGVLRELAGDVEQRFLIGVKALNETTLEKATPDRVAMPGGFAADTLADRIVRRIQLAPFHSDFEASVPKTWTGILNLFRTQVFFFMSLLGFASMFLGTESGRVMLGKLGGEWVAGIFVALSLWVAYTATASRKKAESGAVEEAKAWVRRESRKMFDDLRKITSSHLETAVRDAGRQLRTRIENLFVEEEPRLREAIRYHEERRGTVESVLKDLSTLLTKIQERGRKLEDPERALVAVLESAQ